MATLSIAELLSKSILGLSSITNTIKSIYSKLVNDVEATNIVIKDNINTIDKSVESAVNGITIELNTDGTYYNMVVNDNIIN